MTETILQEWCIANWVPLFKRGLKVRPEILGVLGEMFEGFIRDVILEYLY